MRVGGDFELTTVMLDLDTAIERQEGGEPDRIVPRVQNKLFQPVLRVYLFAKPVAVCQCHGNGAR